MAEIGILLNIAADHRREDAAVVRDHLALGDLAEPLGFESLFVLEHHFSGYIMSPAPLELLAFYAGRTTRIKLGTAVVVLPWHDPVRVAEQISILDIMCGGRCLFAFGRGRAESEFKAFRIPMEEARGRFVEAAEIVIGALTNERFEYCGAFYRFPELSVRPRPFSRPQERFYAAAMGHESAAVVARLGFGLLTSTQKAWAALADDIAQFHQLANAFGYQTRGPIVLSAVSVAKSRQEARDRAFEYIDREWEKIDHHYRYSEGRIGRTQGYEAYVGAEQYFQQLADRSFREHATAEYMSLQFVGTPDDCIQQIEELIRLTGLAHLVLEFSYGGMPSKDAENNLRVFARDVLPVFQRQGSGRA